MRKNASDLALSEPVLKYENVGLFSDDTHPEGGHAHLEPDSCESIATSVMEEIPANADDVINATVTHKRTVANVLIQVMKIIFTCWYKVFELIFDVVTNKWVWNVLLITLYVLFDVFFHLVLAASAIMVTIIINIDNVYRKREDEEEDDLESTITSCTDINGVYEKESLAYRRKK